MTLDEYVLTATGRRRKVCGMAQMELGDSYIGWYNDGSGIEIPNLDDALAIIGSEFPFGISAAQAPRHAMAPPFARRWVMVVRPGKRPCDLQALKRWVVYYSLTERWDIMHTDRLKRKSTCE